MTAEAGKLIGLLEALQHIQDNEGVAQIILKRNTPTEIIPTLLATHKHAFDIPEKSRLALAEIHRNGTMPQDVRARSIVLKYCQFFSPPGVNDWLEPHVEAACKLASCERE